MALVEIALALLVLAVASLGSVSWTLSGMDLDVSNQEQAQARAVMRRLLEELQTVAFGEVFARYNLDAQDDPDGAGTAPGASFVVQPSRTTDLLLQRPADVAGTQPDVAYRRVPLRVQVEFPVDRLGRLSEVAQDGTWGDRLWDLDGDGRTDGEDLGTRYVVLPVRVRLSWTGSRGRTHTLEHVRLLSRRDQAWSER